jgi:hypothetical protein
MIFIPVLVVIMIAIIFTPTSGGSRRRKQKGFFETLVDNQRKTEKRNISHKGIMSGPGGSKKRK